MSREQKFDVLKDQFGDITVYELFDRAVNMFGSNTFLIDDAQSYSYKQCAQKIQSIAVGLHKRGVRPGDRVVIFIPNSIAFYLAYFAVWQCRATVVPLNTFLSAREIEHVLRDCNPQLIVSVADAIARIKNAAPRCEPVVVSDLEHDASGSAVLESGDGPEYAAVLYTSGTTGLPKGVALTSKNIMTNVLQGLSCVALTSDDRMFAVLPLFHSFAQCASIWMPLVCGGSVIVVARIERRAILRALDHKPTVFLGVPALYGLLCMIKNASIDAVRFFVCGGDVLPDKIRHFFALLYRRTIINGYGLTETSPLISLAADGEWPLPGDVGCPVPGIAVSVRDCSGKEVARGDKGVLWVQGDNVMAGYYGDQKATDKIIQNTWLCTGDFAVHEKSGRLRIVGRQKDLIINKGLNIYPSEIEHVLLQHPSVVHAAVVGKDADGVGQWPVAFVTCREKKAGLEDTLKKWAGVRLAAYKVPREIIVRSDLPMTTTGKVDKVVLRKEING